MVIIMFFTRPVFIGFAKSICSVFSITALALIIQGCGAGSSSTGNNSSSSISQRFIGSFNTSNNELVSSSTVTILNNGDNCNTSDASSCVIETANLWGKIDFEIEGAWGSSRFSLTEIPAQTESVSYQVEIDPDASSAHLMSIEVSERELSNATISSALPASRCALCHELHQFTRCALPTWVELHRGIFNCELEGEIVPSLNIDPINFEEDLSDTTSEPSNQQSNSSSGSSKPKEDPNAKYKKGLCVTCHSFQGPPECSNSTWKALHGSFYSCGGSSGSDKKKKDKKKQNATSAANLSELSSFLMDIK